MRILHVTPYFEGAWAYGGIPRAAAVMAHGAAARGHGVTVCTTDACRPKARLAGGSYGDGVRSPRVEVFRNASNWAAYHLQAFMPLGLGPYLRERAGEFDVAHLHGCHHLPGAIAARHLRRAGVPYVLTPNGTAPYIERRRMAKRLFDATAGRGVLEGAARVVAVSRAERAQLVAFGVDAERIVVIPNPVELSEFHSLPRGRFRSRHRIDAAAPLVTYLGKLTPRKRLDTLVESFAALRSADARLVIAGNDMGYGRQLARLVDRFRLRDRVLITGLLTGRARLEALADADVVAYASELEVFGLVAVEALLAGTPVVVADDSGCGEVVADAGGGRLVPPGDPVALRDALALVLRDRPVWRQHAAAARERLLQYSSDAVAAALESVYEDVTGRGTLRLPAAV